ncbi:alpha/beta fold hydrolase [Methylibium sp.]|uniref:alpha/beta fold hydrolase n=1 Tax=Methylibium sp. TaxID=2067992 RepID=UPI0025F3420D|nr:alpha/beta fold hydrolase [Methylibium sp.]
MSTAPNQGQTLPTGEWLAPLDGHRVWWCEGGDARGVPVLIVHGGPGGASRIEPAGWLAGLPVRWIAIDQRGCGRSTPLGETAHNTLHDLLADMERLREQLGIERWALTGGSWGARVALRYAAGWPQRVNGLLLRSPFLGGLAETRRYIAPWPAWLGQEGEAWLGEEAAAAVLALYQRSTESLCAGTGLPPGSLEDEKVARVWAAFDDAQSAPGGALAGAKRCSPATLKALTETQTAAWRVHLHFARRGWGECDGHPRGLPAAELALGPSGVVCGADDATCDPALANELGRVLPGARVRVVPSAGHRLGDPQLAPALADAAREWIAALLRK